MTLAFINALNAFMLKNGLDIASKAIEIQQALQPFVLRCWRVSRDAKLKEALVLLLHIQLQLQGIQVATLCIVLWSLGCIGVLCHYSPACCTASAVPCLSSVGVILSSVCFMPFFSVLLGLIAPDHDTDGQVSIEPYTTDPN